MGTKCCSTNGGFVVEGEVAAGGQDHQMRVCGNRWTHKALSPVWKAIIWEWGKKRAWSCEPDAEEEGLVAARTRRG